MRIVYMGSPAEVIPPLLRLNEEADCDVVGVVSQPPRRSGRKRVLTDPPLAAFAKEAGLPLWQPARASSPDFIAQLGRLQPDVIITAAYGQILSEQFLAIPRRAVINIHPSLLPRHRGATPVQATLLAGDQTAGVTILFTVKELDAGNLIVQERYEILPGETTETLLTRLFRHSSLLLISALGRLREESFQGEPQDPDRVTHCGKICKEDGLVDWRLDSETLYRRFRAFQPWPGFYSFLGDQRVAMTAVKPMPGSAEPGKFTFDAAEKLISVGTGDGNLGIMRLKPAGRNEVDAASFWNGMNKDGAMSFTIPGRSD